MFAALGAENGCYPGVGKRSIAFQARGADARHVSNLADAAGGAHYGAITMLYQSALRMSLGSMEGWPALFVTG